MSKELMYIRFLQISVCALTLVIVYGIKQAKNGNIKLHKKINLGVLSITAVAVVGLLVTLAMGFNYKEMKIAESLLNIGPESMEQRILIHRFFSAPLFFALSITAYSGAKNKVSLHKKSVKYTAFFWMGTLITALLFF
ncbi:MAG: DUF420 domain-containing protein [Lentisphaeraceae bacterium]|nr:DUF420 domain-containing protein [Lentisphaeraceae bacterium]